MDTLRDQEKEYGDVVCYVDLREVIAIEARTTDDYVGNVFPHDRPPACATHREMVGAGWEYISREIRYGAVYVEEDGEITSTFTDAGQVASVDCNWPASEDVEQLRPHVERLLAEAYSEYDRVHGRRNA